MAAETTPEGEEAPASFCVPVADRDTYDTLLRLDQALRDACLHGVLNDEDGMVLDRARRAVNLQRMTRGEAPLSGPDLYEWAKERATQVRSDRDRLVVGGTFALDLPDTNPALWGQGEEVLWSQGEPLFIVGPPSIGKSTLALRLVLARIGVSRYPLLGYPVAVDSRRVLYVAADRPRQIRRNLHRMVHEADRALLDERLIVWSGPLGFNLAEEPQRLAELCRSLGVGMVVLDSLKDVALKLTDGDAGAAVNLALQTVVDAGVEVVVVHHNTKHGPEGRAPKELADVYGSAFITAGAGSVVLLWGRPGDPVVRLSHLKSPMAPVGPMDVELTIDGQVVVHEGRDPLGLLRASPEGMTVADLGAC